jgi:hypothetical protein
MLFSDWRGRVMTAHCTPMRSDLLKSTSSFSKLDLGANSKIVVDKFDREPSNAGCRPEYELPAGRYVRPGLCPVPVAIEVRKRDY